MRAPRLCRPIELLFAAASAVLLLAGGALAAPDQAPELVVFDNDFYGPASSEILPLIADPKIKVLGLTVVTGDGWLDEETADTLRFLEIIQRTDIPVVKGAVFPLVNSQARTKAWEHMYGKIVWKGAWNDAAPGASFHPTDPYLIPPSVVGAPTLKATSGVAAQFLIDQVRRYPHRVTILAAGPMTNIALAIRLDPEFASLAKQLVFMGALIDTNLQQVTVSANFATDFNIWFDPEAADITLTAPWARITAVGNVSNTIAFTPQLAARIAAKKTPVSEAVAKYSMPLPLWDQLAAAITADPSLVTQEVVANMDVDIGHGLNYGVTHVWPDVTTPHLGERPVHIVLAVDTARFLAGFVADAQIPAGFGKP